MNQENIEWNQDLETLALLGTVSQPTKSRCTRHDASFCEHPFKPWNPLYNNNDNVVEHLQINSFQTLTQRTLIRAVQFHQDFKELRWPVAYGRKDSEGFSPNRHSHGGVIIPLRNGMDEMFQ
jgi:hypothetical protein